MTTAPSGTRTDLLDIALTWRAWGCPVLPVIFVPKKNGQGTEKVPIVEKYEHWKNGEAEQTADDIIHMQDKYGNPSWERAQGVGIMLWPTSDRLVLDYDGDPNAAEQLLTDAGVTVPPTGWIHTRSGGRHDHFRVPPGLAKPDPAAADRDKRRIRLLHATDAEGKPCKPAVDFLFNGIAVVAGDGYREDPDHPVDPEQLAIIPESILALARTKRTVDPDHADCTARPSEYAALLRGVPGGIEHDTSVKLIGHYLPKLGPDETWALMEDWCDRCTPPADKRKVRANFEDILRKEQTKEQRKSAAEPTGPPSSRSLQECFDQYVRDLQDPMPRLSLGYTALDKYHRGIARGEVLVAMARTAVGKTAFAMNVLQRSAVTHHIPALWFSLEMAGEEDTERILALELDEPSQTVAAFLHHPNTRISQAAPAALERWTPVRIIDAPCRVEDIDAAIGAHPDVRLVVVDYLGMIVPPKHGSVYEATSELARSLKRIAGAHRVAMLVLAQIGRQGETGGVPVTLRDARDSGAIEEAANYVLGLWRPDLAEENGQPPPEVVDLKVRLLKNRSGAAPRTVTLAMDLRTLCITDKETTA